MQNVGKKFTPKEKYSPFVIISDLNQAKNRINTSHKIRLNLSAWILKSFPRGLYIWDDSYLDKNFVH